MAEGPGQGNSDIVRDARRFPLREFFATRSQFFAF